VAERKDKTLELIVSALKKEFTPTRLFLFGSRALGKARKDSDYDFVVVVKRMRGSRVDNMMRASRALDHLDISADVFVYSEKEFNDWKDELSSIPETALNTGREIPLG
jgi:predicted nucleotidyltransferase